MEDNPEKPIILDDSTFKEAIEKYPKLVVDFWAEWCGPCRMIGPIVEELAGEMKGDVVFGKVNVDQSRQTASENNIMSIPTLQIYKDGQLVNSIVGAMPKDALKAKIMENF